MGNCSFAVLLAKIATTRGNYCKGCGGAAKRLAEAFPLATRSADVHHNPQQTISLAKCSADAHHTLNKRFRSQNARRTPAEGWRAARGEPRNEPHDREIYHMNHVCKEGGAYTFTDEDHQNRNLLVDKARDHCAIRSDLFINHTDFYPKLKPEYVELVPRYTQAAKDAGAVVHDGRAYLTKLALRDHMHWAPRSTPAVVDMYFSAVAEMVR